jgi:hypothetical protein
MVVIARMSSAWPRQLTRRSHHPTPHRLIPRSLSSLSIFIFLPLVLFFYFASLVNELDPLFDCVNRRLRLIQPTCGGENRRATKEDCSLLGFFTKIVPATLESGSNIRRSGRDSARLFWMTCSIPRGSGSTNCSDPFDDLRANDNRRANAEPKWIPPIYRITIGEAI